MVGGVFGGQEWRCVERAAAGADGVVEGSEGGPRAGFGGEG